MPKRLPAGQEGTAEAAAEGSPAETRKKDTKMWGREIKKEEVSRRYVYATAVSTSGQCVNPIDNTRGL